MRLSYSLACDPAGQRLVLSSCCGGISASLTIFESPETPLVVLHSGAGLVYSDFQSATLFALSCKPNSSSQPSSSVM